MAATLGLVVASARPVAAEESRLVAGPILAPSLPAPGWMTDHLASWVNDHPGAYAASCRTDTVENELQYLQRLVARDQELRDTARAQLMHAVVEGESTAKRHTDVAVDALLPLDSEITDIDRLLIRLTALPTCSSGVAALAAQPPPKPAAAATTPVPVTGTEAPAADKPAASPAPAAPPPTSPATAAPSAVPAPAAAPAAPRAVAPVPPPPAPAPMPEPSASPAAATPAEKSADIDKPGEKAAADKPAAEKAAVEKPAQPARDKNLVLVRFDSKVPGLTPKSIRRLDAALAALDAGKDVQIGIEGCENPESLPEGTDCAALVRRLKRILVDRGVDRPDELIATPH